MNLHDAVLQSIAVDWPARTVELRLSAVGPVPVSIRASGLVDLHMPRRQPWGPSASVLEVETSEGEPMRLVLHMQSGDDLTLEATEITVDGAA